MPRTTKPAEAAETEHKTPEPVRAAILPKHLRSPHWIELRRDDEGHFIDSIVHDEQNTLAVGAKSLEAILREAGAAPVLHSEERIEILFSPYTGEIVAVGEVERVPAEAGPTAA